MKFVLNPVASDLAVFINGFSPLKRWRRAMVKKVGKFRRASRPRKVGKFTPAK